MYLFFEGMDDLVLDEDDLQNLHEILLDKARSNVISAVQLAAAMHDLNLYEVKNGFTTDKDLTERFNNLKEHN